MLTTLERMSWLVLLLATATFMAYLQPPGGLEKNQVLVSEVWSCSAPFAAKADTANTVQVNVANTTVQINVANATAPVQSNNVTATPAQCAMLAFFVLDGLSFGLSMGCLVMIVVLSMPRIQWADPKAEAGRFYLLLLLTWLLLYLAVMAGFAAFVASGLSVHQQWGVVVGPVAPGGVLLVFGALLFIRRFTILYPGWAAVKAARPFQDRELEPVESDVELGQARFWRHQLRILPDPAAAPIENTPLLGRPAGAGGGAAATSSAGGTGVVS